MLITPQREQLLGDLAAGFAARGIEALALRGPNIGLERVPEDETTSWLAPAFEPPSDDQHSHAAHVHSSHEMVLLVRPADEAAARGILETTKWRFQLGDRGPWRMFRTAAYLYDDRLGIDLMWGVPGSPLPIPRLKVLERELWVGATRGAYGFLDPEPEPLVVFLATQAVRLHIRGAHRYASWSRDLATCASRVRSWQRVWEVARRADAEDPVRRGLALADARDAPTPLESSGPVADARWAVANMLIRHGWPRRIRGYAAAAPRLGTVTARVRFAGVVLNVGRGVFAPRGLAESLVEEAVRAFPSQTGGVVVDVGTGCGPVPLAIASAMPDVEIHATEISRPALLWAEWNRRRLGASNVSFHRGSVLDPLPNRLRGRVRVLTANLPYVPIEEWQDGWRGREFQVVGPDMDGLGNYRRLARQARAFLKDDARVIMQMESRQWDGFADELRDLGYRPGEILRQWGNDVVVWSDVSPIG